MKIKNLLLSAFFTGFMLLIVSLVSIQDLTSYALSDFVHDQKENADTLEGESYTLTSMFPSQEIKVKHSINTQFTITLSGDELESSDTKENNTTAPNNETNESLSLANLFSAYQDNIDKEKENTTTAPNNETNESLSLANLFSPYQDNIDKDEKNKSRTVELEKEQLPISKESAKNATKNNFTNTSQGNLVENEVEDPSTSAGGGSTLAKERRDGKNMVTYGTVCSDREQDPLIVDYFCDQTTQQCVPLTAPAQCPSSPDSGMPLADINGTDESDIIYGLTGLDVINGMGGSDILDGGPDDDQINGGDANDIIYGSLGDDMIYGENGNDNLVGYFGNDFLSGGKGTDELYGGAGNDILTGGRGADFIDCGEDVDTVLDFNPRDGDVIANNCEIVSSKK